MLSRVTDPRNISIWPDHHSGGSRDHADCRKLPRAVVRGVDRLNPIAPRADVERAGLAEVEEDRPGIVQQGEYPQRSVAGGEVEIGHAASQQRGPVAEVVVNVEAGDLRGHLPARLVSAQEL